MKFSFAHLVGGRSAAPPAPGTAAPAPQVPLAPGASVTTPAAPPAPDASQPAPSGQPQPSPAPAMTEAEAAAYARGRDRCAAIFAAPEAAGRIEMAAQLAFGTDLPVEQAIGILKATPAATAATPTPPPPANPFLAVMGAIPNPQVAADPGLTGGGGDEAQAEVAAILNVRKAVSAGGNA